MSVIIAAALQYLLDHPEDAVDVKAFEEACGVGVTVLPEEIEAQVSCSILCNKCAALENFQIKLSEKAVCTSCPVKTIMLWILIASLL